MRFYGLIWGWSCRSVINLLTNYLKAFRGVLKAPKIQSKVLSVKILLKALKVLLKALINLKAVKVFLKAPKILISPIVIKFIFQASVKSSWKLSRICLKALKVLEKVLRTLYKAKSFSKVVKVLSFLLKALKLLSKINVFSKALKILLKTLRGTLKAIEELLKLSKNFLSFLLESFWRTFERILRAFENSSFSKVGKILF